MTRARAAALVAGGAGIALLAAQAAAADGPLKVTATAARSGNEVTVTVQNGDAVPVQFFRVEGVGFTITRLLGPAGGGAIESGGADVKIEPGPAAGASMTVRFEVTGAGTSLFIHAHPAPSEEGAHPGVSFQVPVLQAGDPCLAEKAEVARLTALVAVLQHAANQANKEVKDAKVNADAVKDSLESSHIQVFDFIEHIAVEAARRINAAYTRAGEVTAALKAARNALDAAKKKLADCLAARSTSGRTPLTLGRCEDETIAGATAEGKVAGLAQALAFERRIAAAARGAVVPLRQARTRALALSKRVTGTTGAKLRTITAGIGKTQAALARLLALPTAAARQLAAATTDAASSRSALAACRTG